MTQDTASLDISTADWADIDAALLTLETKLGAKLTDLTTEQRRELTKMGGKSETFCRATLVAGRQNVAKLPPDTASDLVTEEEDLADLDQLRPRINRLTSLLEKADDTDLALRSDIMVYCLSLYGVLKAIGAGAGLDEIRAQIGSRFARGPRKPPPTP